MLIGVFFSSIVAIFHRPNNNTVQLISFSHQNNNRTETQLNKPRHGLFYFITAVYLFLHAITLSVLNMIGQPWLILYSILLSLCWNFGHGFVVTPLHHLQKQSCFSQQSLSLHMKGDGIGDQAAEALHSLCDFHQGHWKGKSTSFTVSDDVAAGIIQKKTSDEYQLDVKIGYDKNDLAISETFSWQGVSNQAARSLSISNSNLDVDAVDASYSADSSLPDLPSAITGTGKFIQFAVEQCVAISDDERVRLFSLYQDKLVRVVLCEERRLPETPDVTAESVTEKLSTSDLLDMQDDVDRLVDKIAGQMKGSTPDPRTAPETSSPQDKLDRLQASLSRSNSSSQKQTMASDNNSRPLFRHSMSLLDLTSGVWLGDAIIRDFPSVTKNGQAANRKGFGSSAPSKSSSKPGDFGSWDVGVQKVARQWLWDFGDEIRQVNDAGKAMGVEMDPVLGKSISGAICGKKSFSRRVPKDDRMIYVDWNDGNGGDHVGFIVGSFSVQIPRFLSFGQREGSGGREKPFYTELCVYQSDTKNKLSDSLNLSTDPSSDGATMDLPEICCSRICRVYNSEGHLKQGCTSFYTLKRFGGEMDNDS